MPASFRRTPGDAVVVANSGHNRFVANMEQQTANAVVASLHDDGDVVAAASMPQLEIRASFFLLFQRLVFGSKTLRNQVLCVPEMSDSCVPQIGGIQLPLEFSRGNSIPHVLDFKVVPGTGLFFGPRWAIFFSPNTTIL